MSKTYFIYSYFLQNSNMQSFRFYNVKILPIFVIQNAMNRIAVVEEGISWPASQKNKV